MTARLRAWLAGAGAFVVALVVGALWWFRRRALVAEKQAELARLTKEASVLRARRDESEKKVGAGDEVLAEVAKELARVEARKAEIPKEVEGLKSEDLARALRDRY